MSAFLLGLFCEGPADERTACGLVDRLLCESVDWIEPQALDSFRRWMGIEAPSSFLKWSSAKDLAVRRGIKINVPFELKGLHPDFLAARRALVLFGMLPTRPAAVVLVRDEDDEPRRREAMERAATMHAADFAIVVGVAGPTREAWVLAGYSPQNSEEEKRLQELTHLLGFDPRTNPDRLNDPPGQPRHRKTVLQKLTDGDLVRERACWEASPLSTLEERGRETGLPEFLEEVRAKLVPLFR